MIPMKTSSGRFSVASLLGLGTLVLFAGCSNAPMRHSTLALESEDSVIPLGVTIPGYERPVAVQTVTPEHPLALKRLGIDGQVDLMVAIDATGRVTDAQVASSTEDAFEQAALEAVKQWTFKPATQNGVAVASRGRMPINFSFND